jgi:hypothetical protein
MFKKALLIATFILFSATLVYGAANRTMAKSTDFTPVIAQQTGSGGQGRNQTNDSERAYRNSYEPLNQGGAQDRQGLNSYERLNEDSGRQGNGEEQQGHSAGGSRQGSQGGGNGENRQAEQAQSFNQGQGTQGNGGRQQSQTQPGRGQQAQYAAPIATTVLSGIVAQAPAPGVELILQTSAGDVQIGTGPNYLGEMGFVLNAGDEISVSGYWEDGEFKASTITLLNDGTSIALRDESGRPMWSGAARGGRGGSAGA